MQMWIREQVGFLSETSLLIIRGCSWLGDASKTWSSVWWCQDLLLCCICNFFWHSLHSSWKVSRLFFIFESLAFYKTKRTYKQQWYERTVLTLACLVWPWFRSTCCLVLRVRHPYHSSHSLTPCQRCVYGPLELEWAPQAESLPPQRRPGQREERFTNVWDHNWRQPRLSHTKMCYCKSPIMRVIWISKDYSHHLELNVQLPWWAKHWRFCCKKRPHTWCKCSMAVT